MRPIVGIFCVQGTMTPTTRRARKMKRHIHAGFVAGMLLASGIAQAADQINESEINHPIGFAQKIAPSSGTAIISGVLGNTTGAATNDTDYYVFYGMEGDVVTLDIDGGMGGAR